MGPGIHAPMFSGGDSYWGAALFASHLDAWVDKKGHTIYSYVNLSPPVTIASPTLFGKNTSKFNPDVNRSDASELHAVFPLSEATWWDDDITIALWIYEGSQYLTASPRGILMIQDTANGSHYVDLSYSYGSPNTISASFLGKAAASSTSCPIDTWHFVTLVKEGLDLYLGIDGTVTKTTNTGTYYHPSGDMKFLLGIQPGASGGYQHKGNLAECRIYKTAIPEYKSNFTPPTEPFPES